MSDLLGLPIQASAHAGKLDSLNLAIHALMLVIFVGWGIFFVYCLLRFRKKKNPTASYHGVQGHASTYAEVAVVIAEAVLLVGFSIPFWAAEVDALPKPEENALNVYVVAEQFMWNVHYSGPDGVFGRTDIALIDDQINYLGLDPEDANGNDDYITRGTLTVPVGRPIVVHLTTKDVIHSFALPELRVKRDAIPGMSVAVPFTPTMTTDEFRKQTGNETRNFEIACAQLCGITHYNMRGVLRVLPQEEFDQWLSEKIAEKQASPNDPLFN